MWNKIFSAVENGIRDLSPAYFALVMATGIVSIAARLEGLGVAAICVEAAALDG